MACSVNYSPSGLFPGVPVLTLCTWPRSRHSTWSVQLCRTESATEMAEGHSKCHMEQEGPVPAGVISRTAKASWKSCGRHSACPGTLCRVHTWKLRWVLGSICTQHDSSGRSGRGGWHVGQPECPVRRPPHLSQLCSSTARPVRRGEQRVWKPEGPLLLTRGCEQAVGAKVEYQSLLAGGRC